MFVAGANKVKGSMNILMNRNQWDFGIHLLMTLLKFKQGHLETAILILHNFYVFYYS